MNTLCAAALDVLGTPGAIDKAKKTRAYAESWRAGDIREIGRADLPARPARSEKPQLLPPKDMPKRAKAGSPRSKIALLHALAHIELNAIDLAWDVMARFSHFAYCHSDRSDSEVEESNQYASGSDPSTRSKAELCSLLKNRTTPAELLRLGMTTESFFLPKAFYDDWVQVADDEAKHHLMLEARLNALGASYGDLPAHDGLWEASEKTAHDFAARLAIVPMVLEARGLDVTPGMIGAMKKQGDVETAEMLQIIHDDEITHVRAGTVWFETWCVHHGRDVEETWQALVRTYFNGHLKRPFNHPSREEAGMIRDWYEPLAEALKPQEDDAA